MNIDSIKNGIVIDHITAGRGMEIYNHLHLGDLDCAVALIKNAQSRKMGRKDIIKIDEILDIDLNVLGYIDPNITVNIIKDGKLEEKKHLELPRELVNVISCSNPRCITTTEQEIDQRFVLADREAALYRCAYCEAAYKKRS